MSWSFAESIDLHGSCCDGVRCGAVAQGPSRTAVSGQLFRLNRRDVLGNDVRNGCPTLLWRYPGAARVPSVPRPHTSFYFSIHAVFQIDIKRGDLGALGTWAAPERSRRSDPADLTDSPGQHGATASRKRPRTAVCAPTLGGAVGGCAGRALCGVVSGRASGPPVGHPECRLQRTHGDLVSQSPKLNTGKRGPKTRAGGYRMSTLLAEGDIQTPDRRRTGV